MDSLEEIADKLTQAMKLLHYRDSFLLEHRAHERTITSKLAEYLQQTLPAYNVDCEYNLHGSLPKRLRRVCGGKCQEFVFPDIVVHQRGNDENNLLVVEAKPRKKSEVPECDRIKLEEFTKLNGDYRYKFGLFIGFDKLCAPQLVWFTDGREEAPMK